MILNKSEEVMLLHNRLPSYTSCALIYKINSWRRTSHGRAAFTTNVSLLNNFNI